jgi:hypothetical protein
MAQIADHNLGLPDQTFSDAELNEFILRARLDEAEWFVGGIAGSVPGWAGDRVRELRRRAREAVEKREWR